MIRKILLLLIFTFIHMSYGQDVLDEGLYFYSSEVNPDQRTSLDITPNTPFCFKENFSLEFEINFRKSVGRPFGNIFKIIGDEALNIDMVANLEGSEGDNFWLAIKDEVLFKYKWSDILKGDYNKWLKFSLEVDIENTKLTMSINGDKIIKTSKHLEDIKDFKIIFGKSLYKNFSTSDVCPMSIRNIKIINKEDKTIREWSLGKHTVNNKVYDKLKNDEAIAINPKWLIDQHVFWKKNKDFDFDDLLGTAKDKTGNRIFIIDKKNVHVYFNDTGILNSYPYEKNSVQCQSVSFVYNHLTDKLIAYSIDENTYYTFQFETSKWSGSDKECIETAYTHHNKLISPQDSTLITFGGYGYYSYKSSIKNFKHQQLRSVDLDSLIPSRYLSSSGVFNPNEFLIFGGYGSPSGKQGVNSHFYYDLYSVTFDDFKVKKLWELDYTVSTPFVPVQSMVVDNNSDTFYTLIYNNTTYNTYLKLARFGIKEHEMTVFTDSIPYKFLDIRSNTDFFLNANKTKLYTLTSIDNKVSLSSLTYPPLFASDIYQEEIPQTIILRKYYWIILLLLILISLFVVYKMKKKPIRNITKKLSAFDKQSEIILPKDDKIKTSAIYLFGGFQAYDIGGNDITALFTPTLKQLFTVVLLSGIKNNKGISSIKLTDLLWPNKSESNARNNRNVNISKLRILLEKIGNIEINNENAYWHLNFGDSVFCDYLFVKDLMNNSDSYSEKESSKIYKLLKIVSNGEIAPDIQSEWIENYRSDNNNALIDFLTKISNRIDDLHIRMQIGNTILKHSLLDEQGIILKCKSLYEMGKKGDAKRAYNKFCQEYIEVLDTNFDKSFKEIIS